LNPGIATVVEAGVGVTVAEGVTAGNGVGEGPATRHPVTPAMKSSARAVACIMAFIKLTSRALQNSRIREGYHTEQLLSYLHEG
jgi:hypothetical protein